MTELQIQKLEDYYNGTLSKERFLKEFGEEMKQPEFIKRELHNSMASKNKDTIERAISLLWFSSDYGVFLDELNLLLLDPNHGSHQVITKTIQDLANPKSIAFIKKALDTNFDYLEYTRSDSEAIAKWFSWALYCIGTKEAIDVMKLHSSSNNLGIRNEMLYRLNIMQDKITNK